MFQQAWSRAIALAFGVLALLLAASIARVEPDTPPPRDSDYQPASPITFDRARAEAQLSTLPLYDASTGETLSSATAVASWEFLGPGNIGGRTRAIVFDPVQPNIVYAGAVGGGIWKSLDRGQSWTAIGDGLSNLNVASLAIDPLNRATLYAGTGEITGSTGPGNGIFKSTDSGATWTQLAATASQGEPYPPFSGVNDIAVSATVAGRVYAATRGGLHRSTNGGTTWSLVRPITNSSGCTDIALASDRTPDELVVACGTTPPSLWRSVDAGDTWTKVRGFPEGGRASLARAPQNQNVVFALVSGTTTGYLGLFRSNDGGATWSTVHHHSNQCNQLDQLFGGQGMYNNVVAVDPLDINRIWAGGDGLYRSDDGGSTWGPVGRNDHVDRHAIVFPPDFDGVTMKSVFVGSDGGVSRADARGPIEQEPCTGYTSANDVTQWTSLNNGYGVTQFYHGAVSPDGSHFLGGTQDNGNVFGNLLDGPNNWIKLTEGDGGRAAFGSDSSTLMISWITNGLMRSTNGGVDWEYISGPLGMADLNTKFMGRDPNNPQVLWMLGDYVWRTTDQGANWAIASTALPCCYLRVGALAVAPGDSNHVVFSTGTEVVHRSTAALAADSTTVWQSASLGVGDITSLTFDPTNANVVYATSSNPNSQPHLWKSTDGGASWSSFDNGIPDMPVWSMAVHPGEPSHLFLGTELGVLVSVDGGATWLADSAGLPRVNTGELAIRKTASGTFLYAFTHGRGAWRVQLAPDQTPFAFRFNDRTGLATGTEYTSNAVTISGIDAPTEVTITGGTYSINGGAYTNAPGTVTENDKIRVRLWSSPDASTKTSASLTVGGVSDTFSVTTGTVDSTPQAFAFVDQSSVNPASTRVSNLVTVTGFNTAVGISIVGGSYRINETGTYTNVAGTINPGDTVRVRHVASYEPNTTVDTTLTIGGISDTFSSTTNAKDINPDAFGFATVSNVPVSTLIESEIITPTGYDSPAPVRPNAGTEYRIDGGSWTSADGTISPGSTLQVRHTSAASPDTLRTTSVKIGLIAGSFRTRTAP